MFERLLSVGFTLLFLYLFGAFMLNKMFGVTF